MIELGLEGKDIATGYKGIIFGHTQYLTSCSQVLLVPAKLGKNGERLQGEWFDEQRVKVISNKPLILENHSTPGADEPAAPVK